MAGSRVFHSDLGLVRGYTRLSFARAGSPIRRPGILASNWRLFIACPYKCCIDYIFGHRCVRNLQPGTSTAIGTQKHVLGKYTSPRTMMDAMNWMLKIDNWAPDLFIRNAERMLQNRPSVQLRLLDPPIHH